MALRPAQYKILVLSRTGLELKRDSLTVVLRGRYRRCMAQAFLLFDFGTNEEAAQQARHRLEGWKQAFRLGDKIVLKFERKGTEGAGSPEEGKTGGKGKGDTPNESPGSINVLVRLDFSDHEKLSFQRWLERIPNEEVFKPAKSTVVRRGDAEFSKIQSDFDSLD